MMTPKSELYSFNAVLRGALLAIPVAMLIGAGCKSAETAKDAEPSEPQVGQTTAAASNALVVEVDGSELRQEELDRQVGYAMSSQQMGGIPPEALGPEVMNQIRGEIVDRFIAQHVLLSEAARQGIEADEADVAAAVSEIVAGLPEGLTLADALQGYSMDEAQFREELKKDIRIRTLLEAQTGDAGEATDEEIKAFYDGSQQYFEVPATARTRHILLECAEGASPETHEEKKAEAEAVRAQLVEGADFAELATAHSSCPSAQQGGDLGELTRGQTVPAFEEAAFSQDLNTPGPVVKTQFGYHIIEVQERTDAHVRPLEEVREDIKRFLNDQKKQEVIEAYIQDLRGQSTIRFGDE